MEQVNDRSKDVAPLWIHSEGRGNIQDNDITDSLWHGVAIGERAQPLLQGNRIYANRKSGVFMQDACTPTLLENDIYKNWIGVETTEHADPTLRGNKIRHQRMGGLWVLKEAKGTYVAYAHTTPTYG